MSLTDDLQPLQGSEEQLKAFHKAWEKQKFPCPACNRKLPLDSLNPLQINECPHCKESFFMPRKLGDYFLFEPCGGGGMGSVYKGVSEKFPNKLLAVKILARSECSNPTNIRALINEAEVSANFRDSEYIAACLDHGFLEGEYFTVMPLITGERLDKRIDRLGRLNRDEVLKMTLHILAAEQHIYRHGYLFRDMKPENIIINEYGYAVMLDFGLCIPLSEARDPHDEFISGSPYYMPPERLLGNPEDAPSEIYSIGMVMYNALTGTTFYEADQLEDLAQRHVAKMKISNTAKMRGLDKDIAALLEKMIHQNPQERPQTFQEVFDEVKAMIKDN